MSSWSKTAGFWLAGATSVIRLVIGELDLENVSSNASRQ
jgi:hypothetical protein